MLLWEPSTSLSKDKERYVAKTKKGVKFKKKKRRYSIRYPHRANTNINAEKLKMKELLKDIYE